MTRVTFSLDDQTVARIRQTALRLRKPQSQIVREAVADYAERADRLSDGERSHALGILAGLSGGAPTRTAAGVNRELRELRSARRAGGRRHRPA
jgi:predicted transcriptional regulator